MAVATLKAELSQWQRIESSDSTVEIFYEYIQPPIQLLVYGTGKDSRQLVALSEQIGWDVHSFDARSLSVQGFETDSVVPQKAKSNRTAAIIMTHNYTVDLDILQRLLKSGIRYIGLLGPKHRAQKLEQELLARGCRFTEEERARLYSPVGLDIGAETESEIALSILAEVQAVLSNRTGQSLRSKPGFIHGKLHSEHAPKLLDSVASLNNVCSQD